MPANIEPRHPPTPPPPIPPHCHQYPHPGAPTPSPLPPPGLADDPKAIALEHLISTGCDEYASRPALPPSALVLHEAPLLYQRAVLRSWASARGVVTRDGFLHLFGDTGGTSELRPDQLLFSVKIAPAPARALLRDEHSHTFEVPTIVSGLLGKVWQAGLADLPSPRCLEHRRRRHPHRPSSACAQT